ncbi:MAG: aldehyde dehydrogenase family protein [Oscillibacter sp.]|nr:aldehyde dehydrogenase family protein [Oscillibacter sp.]
MKEHTFYINGRWEENLDGRVMDNRNPATNAVFARVHTAGPQDLERALTAADDAFGRWSTALAAERERILLQAACRLEDMQEEAVSLLIEESGSTWQKAQGEVLGSIAVLRTAAGECRRVGGEVYAPTSQDNLSFSIRCPLGVVLAIAPFNYPLLLALKKVAYALAAGNAVLLKPASATPLSGLLIARIFHDAGLPAGVLNVLPCPGALIGRQLVEDPRVKAVTFTGSSEAGRQIAQQAARHLKRCTMELGGKNPMIVLADYDVEQAAHLAGYGAFFHQGQVCMATSRIIVEKPSYSAFCEQMKKRAEGLKVGDPRERDTVIGPLIDEAQCEVIDRQIQDAVKKGARLLTGGHHTGPFYAPTVLADVTPEMDIFQQESFGPVTSVICAEDAEDALALCNNNCYGLSAALLTNDLRKALSLSMRMESGKVHVNDTTFVSGTVAPSGGFKLSGTGKEGGHYSIEEFTELKWITIQYKDRRMPC